MARRRYVRIVTVVAVAVALVVLVTVHFVNQAATNRRRAAAQTTLLAGAAAAAKAAGCTEVKTVSPYPGPDQGHIGADVPTAPPLSSYPSHPPASGPHALVPLDAGVYSSPPDIYRAIHSMEHGAAEVWYSPTASGAELSRLKDVLSGEDHVIVAPYDYPEPGGQLPKGRQIALVAWHRLQLCDTVSAAVAVAFVRSYRFESGDPSAYLGEAPEKGAPI